MQKVDVVSSFHRCWYHVEEELISSECDDAWIRCIRSFNAAWYGHVESDVWIGCIRLTPCWKVWCVLAWVLSLRTISFSIHNIWSVCIPSYELLEVLTTYKPLNLWTYLLLQCTCLKDGCALFCSKPEFAWFCELLQWQGLNERMCVLLHGMTWLGTKQQFGFKSPYWWTWTRFGFVHGCLSPLWEKQITCMCRMLNSR
jgi:hypothetical protein